MLLQARLLRTAALWSVLRVTKATTRRSVVRPAAYPARSASTASQCLVL